ncbi:unnamed protein product [Cuscuta epithymum]|uniref:Leucine-rich repeat-containing N-terminal plant-type domain-containing protein n=1 Tax=Cuscuta epithymum TaxID=186058 RepID=A0AAV0CUU9_9ASTE|nr:unnamed protein product [Cuscuta epithymum]
MGRFLLSSTIEPAIAVAMCVAAISMYTTASRCVDGQREVLLKFKHNILDEYDELRSWGNHTDCCFHWAGVGCDNATGHVIHIGFSGRVWNEWKKKLLIGVTVHGRSIMG